MLLLGDNSGNNENVDRNRQIYRTPSSLCNSITGPQVKSPNKDQFRLENVHESSTLRARPRRRAPSRPPPYPQPHRTAATGPNPVLFPNAAHGHGRFWRSARWELTKRLVAARARAWSRFQSMQRAEFSTSIYLHWRRFPRALSGDNPHHMQLVASYCEHIFQSQTAKV